MPRHSHRRPEPCRPFAPKPYSAAAHIHTTSARRPLGYPAAPPSLSFPLTSRRRATPRRLGDEPRSFSALRVSPVETFPEQGVATVLPRTGIGDQSRKTREHGR